jgi:hypothetical protein
MQTRHAVLTLLALAAAGAGALAFLGSRGALPGPLGDAYDTVASFAASASDPLSAQRTAAVGPDAGDGGSPSIRKTQSAPLSSAQLGAPLVHGKFVTDCGAPDDMKVVVKVTVKMGRAVAVAVTTDPTNSGIASCVEKATREKQWDISPKTQHATVSY